MSKNLLRELLGLNKSSTDIDTDNKTRHSQIYSTDKGRTFSSLSSLPLSNYLTDSARYNDDLSDVSTPLLYKTLNSNEKEVKFFSTDKNKMVKMPASNKLRIIKDLSELSTFNTDVIRQQGTSDQIPSTLMNPPVRNKKQLDTNDTTSYISSSDISSDINLDKYDNSSILSNDLSNKSSYNSNQDTSYDSFFDKG